VYWSTHPSQADSQTPVVSSYGLNVAVVTQAKKTAAHTTTAVTGTPTGGLVMGSGYGGTSQSSGGLTARLSLASQH
jgi:hypothetical protein